MNPSKEPICQSCTMPLSADPRGGGTEQDGNKSDEYCSFCFQNGAFTDPSLTMQGMIDKLTELRPQLNVPENVMRRSIEMLPSLKRWRQA